VPGLRLVFLSEWREFATIAFQDDSGRPVGRCGAPSGSYAIKYRMALPCPGVRTRTRCQGARKGRGAKVGRPVRSGQLFPASPVLQRRYCTTLDYLCTSVWGRAGGTAPAPAVFRVQVFRCCGAGISGERLSCPQVAALCSGEQGRGLVGLAP